MTQVLPESDTFNEGATAAYDDSFLTQYVRTLGWSTDTASGFSLAWSSSGKLYSGWFASPGTPTQKGVSPRPAVCTTSTATVGSAELTGWAFRDIEQVDADVRLSYRDLSLLGGPSGTLITSRAFVGARLRNGTLTNGGTSTAHVAGGDGYWFGVAMSSLSPTGWSYLLLRVNSGTTTKLAETALAGYSAYGMGEPRRLRLVVTGSGGTVTLRGYVKPEGYQLQSGELEVLTFSDTSVSRITGTGRCGFATSNEVLSLGTFRAVALNYFEVRSGAGALLLRDEWERAGLGACAAVTGSPAGFSGVDLACGWYGDLHGVSSFASRIGVDTGANRIEFDSQAAARTGFYTSQRLAADPRVQSRAVDVVFGSGTALISPLVRAGGVALRVSHPTAGANPTSCYFAELRYDDDASTAAVRLWRIAPGATGLLAQKTSGVSVSLDTAYELQLAVSTASVPDPINGYAVLAVYLDGVQVPLVNPANPVAGVTIDASGTVVDASSNRVTSGPAESIYVLAPAGSGRKLYFDAWTAAALPGGGSGVTPESDQASIALGTESDGSTGTLPIPVDWPVAEVRGGRYVIHELDGGHRFAGRLSGGRPPSWRVTASAMTEAERDDLRAFWDDHRGAEIPFAWTPPKTVTPQTVRFVAGSLEERMVDVGVYAVAFELEGCLSGS